MKKTIVITGASRGIGRAIAIELAGKDTNIVINCVNNVDKLNEVNPLLRKKEVNVKHLQAIWEITVMYRKCLTCAFSVSGRLMCLSTMPEYPLSGFFRI